MKIGKAGFRNETWRFYGVGKILWRQTRIFNGAVRAFKEKKSFIWSEGTAEETNLPDSCVDWVLMGSSFHWTEYPRAMKEFSRILKPGGFFTAIWNPRDIKSSELHSQIESVVYGEIPGMKRVSSGGKVTMEEMREKLFFQDIFERLLFMEAPHFETMLKERYMNTWKSVNDIQVQAGEEGFQRILSKIEDIIKNMDEISLPYLSRAWTVRKA